MGLLRLLLAAAVVLAHTPLHDELTGGRLAVESFFMISGFYVALVLDRSYRRPTDFYVNRYLRLAPTYLVLAAASLVSWVAFDVKPFDESAQSLAGLTTPAAGFLAFTNLTMFFQDVVMFLCDAPTGLHWVSDFRRCTPPLFGYLLIPQAWSLGVEIAFYATAPWLLKLSTRTLLGVVLASMGIKALLFAQGLRHDPWDYRFFPSELFLFLTGSLVYRGRSAWRLLADDCLPSLKVWGMIVFTLVFSSLPFGGGLAYLYLSLLALSLPALLKFSSDRTWDRQLGELSYPLYLCHVLVISWLHSSSLEMAPWPYSLCALGSALALSWSMYRLVDLPMERFRSLRRGRASAGVGPKQAHAA